MYKKKLKGNYIKFDIISQICMKLRDFLKFYRNFKD